MKSKGKQNEQQKRKKNLRFSEIMQQVDVDMLHSVKAVELKPDSSSFTLDTLKKWEDINITQDMIMLRQDIFPFIRTLPEIVHHKKKIVNRIISHLEKGSSWTYKPTLELLTALVRDLQSEMYEEFPRIFDTLVNMLEVKHAGKTEAIFKALSYLFHFLRKHMSTPEQLLLWFQKHKAFLGHRKWFIRRFAAQSFAFLIRRLPSEDLTKYLQKSLLEINHENTTPWLLDGVGILFFETVRGVSGRFHSKCANILTLLLQNLDWDTSSSISKEQQKTASFYRYLAIFKSMRLMSKHVDPDHSSPVWTVLKAEIARLIDILQQRKLNVNVKEAISRQIGWICALASYWVQHRTFKEFKAPLEIAQSVMNRKIFHSTRLDRQSKLRILLLVYMLYTNSGARYETEVDEILEVIFEYDEPELVAQLFGNIKHRAGQLFPFLLRYCERHIKQHTALILSLLSNTIQITHPDTRVSLPFKTGCLPFILGMVKSQVSLLGKFETQVKQSSEADVSSVNEFDPVMLWTGVDLLCKVNLKMISKKIVSLTLNALGSLHSILLNSSVPSVFDKMIPLFSVCLECFTRCCSEYNQTSKLLDTFGECKDVLKHHIHSNAVLEAAEFYFKQIKDNLPEESAPYFTQEFHVELLESSLSNLSSSISDVRTNTLSILNEFPQLDLLTASDESKSKLSGTCRILEFGYKIEGQEITLDFSRTVVLYLEKIGSLLTTKRVPDIYAQAAIHHALGVLSIKMQTIWEAAVDLLVSASTSYREHFWNIFLKVLSDNSQEIVAVEVEEDDEGMVYESNKTYDIVDLETDPASELLESKMKPLPSGQENMQQSITVDESQTDPLTLHQSLWTVVKKATGFNKERVLAVSDLLKVFLQKKCHFDIYAASLQDNPEREVILVNDHVAINALKHKLKAFSESKINFDFGFPDIQRKQFIQFCTFYLSHRIPDIQLLALKCLFKFNLEWILPYKASLEKLVDKKRHRDELLHFSLNKESGPIAKEHRLHLIPLIVRIIFVKFGTFGIHKRTHVGKLMSYLAEMDNEEAQFLVNRVLFEITDDEDKITDEHLLSLPSSNLEHFLVLFQEVVSKLRSKLREEVPPLLQGVISILQVFGEEANTIAEPMEESFTTFDSESEAESEDEGEDEDADVDIDDEDGNESEDLEDEESYEGSEIESYDSAENDENVVDINNQDEMMVLEQQTAEEEIDFGGGKIPRKYHFEEPAELSIPQQLFAAASECLVTFFSYYPDYDFTKVELVKLKNAFAPVIAMIPRAPVSNDLFPLLDLWAHHEQTLRMFFPFSDAVNSLFQAFSTSAANNTKSLLSFLDELLIQKDVSIELPKAFKDTSGKNIIRATENGEVTLWSAFLKPQGNVILQQLADICNAVLSKTKKLSPLVQRIIDIMQSLYDAISDTSLAEKLMSVFVPCMKKMATKQHDDLETIMNTILDLLPYYKERSRLLPVIADMQQKITIQAYRENLNKMLTFIGQEDKSLVKLVKTVKKINAFSSVELGGYDFEKRLSAFANISEGKLDSHIREPSHLQILVCNLLYYLKDDEAPIKQGASAALQHLIKISHKPKFLKSEYERQYRGIMNKVLRSVSAGIQKQDITKNEYILLLGTIGSSWRDDPGFEDLCGLQEAGFFEDITHIKNVRVIKALQTYRDLCSQDKVDEMHAGKHFIPIFMKLLAAAPRGSVFLQEIISTLVTQSTMVSWPIYRSLLNSLLRSLNFRSNKQYIFVQTIAEILNNFPFKLSNDEEDTAQEEGEDKTNKAEENAKSEHDAEDTRDPEAIEIEHALVRDVIPRLKKALFKEPNENEKRSLQEKGKERIALIIVHILNVLPKKIKEDQLPLYIQELANKLKSKEDFVRSTTRTTLSNIANVLGPYYLYFILQTLKDTLVEGRMLHVLGYTVHTILHHMSFKTGEIDHCLEILQEILEQELFSTLKSEKTTKTQMAEKKPNSKAFLCYEIIGASFSLSKISELIQSLEHRLEETVSQKTINIVRAVLSMITQGMQKNKSINNKDILAYIYHSIHEKLRHLEKFQNEFAKKRQDESESRFYVKKRYVNRLAENYEIGPAPGRSGALDVDNKSTMRRLAINKYSNTHNLIVFYMELLFESLKKRKITEKRLLDPYVPKLLEWMSSKYDEVSIVSIKIISEYMLKLNLESIFAAYFDIVDKCLGLLGNTMGTANPMSEACFKLLAKLFSMKRTEPSTKQIQFVMRFVKSDLLDVKSPNRESSLKVLKAIVDRKIVVNEVYDLVEVVREMVLTCSPEIQKIAREILIKFFLDYPMNQENIRQQLRFLFKNIDFAYPMGRLSLIDMIGSLISRSPVAFVSEQFELFLLPVVVQLCNETEADCRKALNDLIKTIITNIDSDCIKKLIMFLLKWFSNPKNGMRRAAAQVTSIAIDAYKKQFSRFLDQFLPVLLLNITHGDQMIIEAKAEGEDAGAAQDEPVLAQEQGTSEDMKMKFGKSEWDVTYFTLICFEKLLKYQVITIDHINTLESDFIPEFIELLMHQHPWIRTVTDRIMKMILRSYYKGKIPMRMFLQRNIDSIIRNTILQLHSRYLTNDLSALIQHNALLLIGEARSQNIKSANNTLTWMLAELKRIIVARNLPQSSVKGAMQVISRLSTLYPDIVKEHKTNIMEPLYRVASGSDGRGGENSALTMIAEEVMEQVKTALGQSLFAEVYQEISSRLAKSRSTKKRKMAVMAVTNPKEYANKRIRRNESTQRRRKRKAEQQGGSKKKRRHT